MKYDIANLHEARPSRRSVVRAAAWSVPVIATATTVPAFAASCAPVTVDASDVAASSRVSATQYSATFSAGTGSSPTNVMTVKAAYDAGVAVRNDGNGGTNDNFTIQNPVGGLNTYGLVMSQRLTGTAFNAGAFGRYTFSFTKPVTGLTFTLTDIDSATGDFWDSVWLTPGFTSSGRGSTMTGSGTSDDPFRQANGSTAVDNAGGRNGNVTISYAGTISSFTINYSNRQTGRMTADPDQVVTIANFGFAYQPC